MEKLVEKVNIKTVKITSIFWLLFLILSVVVCMGKTKKDVGMEVFDLMTTGYSFEYATNFVNTASQEALDFYRNVQIPVDFFLAIFLGVFPVVCYLYMKKKISIPSILLYIALFITIFDSVENILLLNILNGGLNKELVSICSTITIAKNICMIPTYIILIIYTVIYNFKKN